MADVPADLKGMLFYTDRPGKPIRRRNADPLRMARLVSRNFDKLVVQVGLPGGVQAEIRGCIEREKARGGDVILYECIAERSQI
ncbi:MAG: hypothetical protein ACLR8L_16275 [Oscillospiraceae bacterium]